MLSRTFAQVARRSSAAVGGAHRHHQGWRRHRQGQSARRSLIDGPIRSEGTPFERFFGDDDDADDGNGAASGGRRPPKQKGLGSGVVIDKKGYILTNNHVVEDADDVKVTFVDGKTVTGQGRRHSRSLEAPTSGGGQGRRRRRCRPAKLGDSGTSRRSASGSSPSAIRWFGLDHTVTVGVLSAKSRSGFQGGSHYEDFLQTDASINPGNSGGPLVNLDGEVIGVNTMIAGIGTGIGFAVPSSTFKTVTDQLIQTGKVRRPYIGIRMQELTPEMAKGLGKNAPEKGALVAGVDANTPAEKAGAKPGDVIVAVNGQKVDASKDVRRLIFGGKVGEKIDLTVWRDGQTLHLSPTTAELPGDEPLAPRGGEAGGNQRNAPSKAKLGIGLSSITPMLAERIGIDPKIKGAVITSVRDGSPAQEAGLQQGDVIVEVDRKPVSTADDAAKTLGSDRSGGHLLRVRRGEGALFVASSPPRNPRISPSSNARRVPHDTWHAPRLSLRRGGQPCVRKVGCSPRRCWWP